MNHRNTTYPILFISNFYKLINSQVFEIRIFNSYYKEAIYYFKNINYSILHIFPIHNYY